MHEEVQAALVICGLFIRGPENAPKLIIRGLSLAYLQSYEEIWPYNGKKMTELNHTGSLVISGFSICVNSLIECIYLE